MGIIGCGHPNNNVLMFQFLKIELMNNCKKNTFRVIENSGDFSTDRGNFICSSYQYPRRGRRVVEMDLEENTIPAEVICLKIVWIDLFSNFI